MEDSKTPSLSEVGVEILDKTFIKPRHQVIQESLMDVVQAQQVGHIHRLESKKKKNKLQEKLIQV